MERLLTPSCLFAADHTTAADRATRRSRRLDRGVETTYGWFLDHCADQ